MGKRMRILVTGGSTWVRIDRVRVISNVFHGRTATEIAQEAAGQGHDVTVLGNPEMLHGVAQGTRFLAYRYFEELAEAMEDEVRHGRFHAVIHSAAVSDYRVEAVVSSVLQGHRVDASGKIGSGHGELCLKLVPTEKLVDKVRNPWGFKGVLVKFKLQVGMTDAELVRAAEASRSASKADIVVANCLEWCQEQAYVLPGGDSDEAGDPSPVGRHDLPATLLSAVRERAAL